MKIALLLLGTALGLEPVTVRSESFVKSAEDRARIEQALPQKAPARPAKPRRLLIFTLNVGYGGHPSIAYANEAFTLMGQKTGAFETVVTDNPDVFKREPLERFDAVFFNNTVGNCFTNADLRQNLVEFVLGGGGLLGVHGTTVAFTRWPGAIEDWPEFGFMLGARGANHKDSDEHVWMKLDDPDNPITQVFGAHTVDYRDEFFRPQGTYSRERVRVLLSMDTTKTDPNMGQPRGDCYRADNDYAVAWIRNYGRGRVFYCTIAHNPYVFWDSKMLQFYLAALQFALGDLPCPTTPSAKVTPAVRAQEKLGWRLAVQADKLPTLSEEIENAARLRLPYIGGISTQRLSAEQSQSLGPGLPDSDLQIIRLKLEGAGLRLISYHVDEMPRNVLELQHLFEFGRKLGIEVITCAQAPAAWSDIEARSEKYGITVALETPPSDTKRLLSTLSGRSAKFGACVSINAGTSASSVTTAADRLKNRLVMAELEGKVDAVTLRKFLSEIRQLQLTPIFLVHGEEAGSRDTRDLFNSECLSMSARTK